MTKITPEGEKLIVYPLPNEETTTENHIVVMDFQLDRGEVMEVSPQLSDRYNQGDVVLFPKGSGHNIHYQKKQCVWLNTAVGDVWGIVTKK